MTTSSLRAFHAITDPALMDRLRLVVGANVRRLRAGTYELLFRRDRHALPAISTAHFTRDDEARISGAFQHAGHPSIYAVALEPLNQPLAFFVPSTREGLREFQRTCSHFNYALCSIDGAAMVVCTTDDYLVYVGSQSFVERCAGTTKAAALRFFLEYADSDAWPDMTRRALVSVHSVLSEVFPVAGEGAFVLFPASPGAE